MAVKEFFLGKKSLKAAGKRNIDATVNDAVKGKHAPKVPAKAGKPKTKPGR